MCKIGLGGDGPDTRHQGTIIMHKFYLTAALLAAVGAGPAKAAQISVENIGAVFNESLALPAEDTPGSGIGFQEFFEFTLPASEIVTVSMSDSATGVARITSGLLQLDTHTSTGPGPLFVPAGGFLESSPILNFLGGQSATVNPDVLGAGSYFAEISGVSGGSPIHIAVDGTITALSTPEPGTWAMLALGFGFLSLLGMRKPRSARLAI
jgi:hypothetical protein